MASFAGWSMPLFYKDMSALDSHIHTRKHCSLFDVSHMLQFKISGPDRIKFIENLIVSDVKELPTGSGTLSLFLNKNGGIEDDLIVTNHADFLYVVSNAGCAEKDWNHVTSSLKSFTEAGGNAKVEKIVDCSLVAIQGPESSKILQSLTKTDLSKMSFMSSQFMDLNGVSAHVARSGYTGEDGFEVSINSEKVNDFVSNLLKNDNVKLAGLAPRDSLRIEAGLCLYGHDIDQTTTPLEAGLTWTIGKRRKQEGGFIGSDIVLEQIASKGGSRRRVGFVVQGAPAREGALIFNSDGTEQIGIITSGVPSPSLGTNIAMGYVNKGLNKKGTQVKIKVRNRMQDAEIVKMPFIQSNYYKP
ncbi:hypothetical protein BB558_007182 [Smittium angustum]|nr:hypothetical protein BB558_007182 [Smittium angustum]